MPKTRQTPHMVSGVKDDDPQFKVGSVCPPKSLDWENPNWDVWLKRWDRYRRTTGLDKMPDSYQVDLLLYTLGEEVEKVLCQLKIKEEHEDKYSYVIERFNSYFTGKVNLVFERSKFFGRRQQPGEPINTFVNDLHQQAQKCKLQPLTDELIMHQLIQGMQDTKLSEALQLEANLTLETAVARAKQAEAVHQQQPVIRGEGPGVIGVTTKVSQGGAKRCGRCGFEKHIRDKCPALDAVCKRCGKKGHFARKCRLRKVQNVQGSEVSEVDDEDGEEYNIGVVKGGHDSRWRVNLEVNGVGVVFRVDTGADVTVISDDLYRSFFQKFRLVLIKDKLFGPGRNPLQIRGKFRASLAYKSKRTEQDIYVICGEQEPLLGKHAIDALKLIKWIGLVDLKDLEKGYPSLFGDIGAVKGECYKIEIDDGVRPFAINAPRRVPLNLKSKVRAELDRLESLGVIEKIDKPTPWVAGMVVVPKKNGEVRICVDYQSLNKAVRRERWILPAVDEILNQLSGAKFFSKLDCRNGYFQIELHPDCKELTTFITPFGRYYYNRMPMGITSAPEVYHKIMTKTLDGMEGVLTLLDDSVVYGRTEEEHDERLRKVLDRLSEKGIVLNKEKCEIGKTRIKFLGHVISDKGIEIDKDKISALVKFPTPNNVQQLRRVLGMSNYYLKFFPQLAAVTAPLRELLSKNSDWVWDSTHDNCFARLKEMLTQAPVLAFFDPTKPIRVAADASVEGLGAVLEQEVTKGCWRPVQFASRRLTDTEKRYSNVEREALGLTWACEKFRDFLVGATFEILTDHRPLVSLLGKKPLQDLTPRIQRFRMRMLPFDYNVRYVKGKEFYVADALSRAPVGLPEADQDILEEESTEFFVREVCSPQVTDIRLRDLQEAQKRDAILQNVVKFLKSTWPEKLDFPYVQFYRVKDSLWMKDNILMYQSRVVVPLERRKEMLEKLHDGHGGENKCRRRAKFSIWWPGIAEDIREKVSKCRQCIEHRVQRAEPLMPTQLPSRPWEMIALDYCKVKGRWYLVAADYYSRYLDIRAVKNMASREAISYLSTLFGLFGIPERIRCDNGTNLISYEMQKFLKGFGVELITNSPKFSQSNGFIESMVKVAKGILLKCSDLNVGLLAHRTTPLENGFSPAELLMGRRLRNTLPMLPENLLPNWPNSKELRRTEKKLKTGMKENFDRRHRVTPLRVLVEGERVWVKDVKKYGVVRNAKMSGLRRYEVTMEDGGVLVRNRRDLIPVSGGTYKEN